MEKLTTSPGPLLSEAELAQFARMASRFLVGRSNLASGHSAASRGAGHGIDFLDHRQYLAGDDPRNIDWRASARSQQPQIKRYCTELSSDWFICIDRSASMITPEHDKWRMASRLAAAMAYILLHLGNRVSLLMFSANVDHVCRLGRGHGQYPQVVNTLQKHGPNSSGGGSSLAACTRLLGERNPIVVISDFLSEDSMRADLSTMWRRHRPIRALQVNSPFEFALPQKDSSLILKDIESGEYIPIEDITSAQKNAHQSFNKMQKDLALYCIKQQIMFTPCSSEENWQDILLRHFLPGSTKS